MSDPLPTPDGDGNKRTKITCEFCECSLSASGDVLKIGSKAKVFRDSEGQTEKLNERIAALDEKIAELSRELEAAKQAAKQATESNPATQRAGLSL